MGSTAESGRVRLHITPFNPELLDRFVPLSIRPTASDISYHTLQTFPERGFGYVELPAAEAAKLKKKLNGMTLKGAKVRIEESRPTKKRKADGPEDENERKERKKAKKEKRKKEQGVLEGHEIDEERYVKRGWEDKGADRKTQKKDKKDKRVSKEPKVENRELRFKTEVPPNIVAIGKPDKEKKEKKVKKGKDGKKKTLVKEFEKRLKLRPVKGKHGKPMTYQEGQGWVDEDGQVVEPEAPSAVRERKSKESRKDKESKRKAATKNAVDDDSDSEVDDSDSELSSEDPSSDEEADEDDDEAGQAETADGATGSIAHESKEVHPLEALFKRTTTTEAGSKPRPQPIDTSFSFFASGEAESDAGEDMDDAQPLPPHTPHTQRDIEWRGLRSGAPTPDTAAIGRHFSFPFPEEDEDEDEEEQGSHMAGPDSPIKNPGSSSAEVIKNGENENERDESEFRKWFYENRGDLNRGWKKRRREERKSKRQRDNRFLSRKVV